MAAQKKKVRMGVELGGSYLDAITELVTIMRFRSCHHHVEQQRRALRGRDER